MLDNYLPREITASNCYNNNTDFNTSEVHCPVKLEVAYLTKTVDFPLSDIITLWDYRYFSNESLKNGTL